MICGKDPVAEILSWLTCSQCDTTQPSCQKCVKIGKECPGYPDEWNLAQRNENELVARKVHGKPSTISSSHVSSNELEVWVIKMFIQDYVLEACGSFDGWLSFLPEMFRQGKDGSILRLSMCAAAYANVYQKLRRKDLEILAIAAYNRALNMAGTVLTTCPKVPSETTLAAIFLLGLYEVRLASLSLMDPS